MKLLNTYEMMILERHLDSFLHVNNATYLEIYEEARWDMLKENGYGLKDIQEDKKGPVVLHIEVAFKSEILLRDTIKIETFFASMKNKMILNLHQTIRNSDDKIASTLDIEIGLMDMVKRKLITPHDNWWRALGLSQEEVLLINS